MHRQLLEACHADPYPGAAEAALLLHEDDEEANLSNLSNLSNLLLWRKGNLSNFPTFKNDETKLKYRRLTAPD